MTKVYITAVQYAQPTKVETYITEKIYELGEKVTTSYPIFPVLERTTDKEDEAVVIAVCVKDKYTKDNLAKLEQLLETVNCAGKKLVPLWFEQDMSAKGIMKMYSGIIKAVPDDSEVYACITYGSKPQSYIMAEAVNYIGAYKKNTVIKGIYYGQYDHTAKDGEERKSEIYDLSAVYLARGFVDTLVKAEIGSSEDVLEAICEEDE